MSVVTLKLSCAKTILDFLRPFTRTKDAVGVFTVSVSELSISVSLPRLAFACLRLSRSSCQTFLVAAHNFPTEGRMALPLRLSSVSRLLSASFPEGTSFTLLYEAGQQTFVVVLASAFFSLSATFFFSALDIADLPEARRPDPAGDCVLRCKLASFLLTNLLRETARTGNKKLFLSARRAFLVFFGEIGAEVSRVEVTEEDGLASDLQVSTTFEFSYYLDYLKLFVPIWKERDLVSLEVFGEGCLSVKTVQGDNNKSLLEIYLDPICNLVY